MYQKYHICNGKLRKNNRVKCIFCDLFDHVDVIMSESYIKRKYCLTSEELDNNNIFVFRKHAQDRQRYYRIDDASRLAKDIFSYEMIDKRKHKYLKNMESYHVV